MHITYDLPVAIDDIIEAKQRLAGRIYKTGMPRSPARCWVSTVKW